MSLRPIDLATARRILNFSGGDKSLENLGQIQLQGAVALHNMIADPEVGVGYLADEVGMGKTYVALGVVALMRYFNPSLRVLYICPSANVQEKWYSREYRSFCKSNVKVNQYRIRTVDGKPAAPRISCRSVPELIHAASLGYFADFFVGMTSFSLALNDDEAQWHRKLEELKSQIPAYDWAGVAQTKKSVKDQYATALNYVLPTFDLVVIDEAHNFKHNFESSDRNRVLSAVLGLRGDGRFFHRVKNALLLSATPYDRNINQLRNQLNLVGYSHLLPQDIEDKEQDRIEAHLSRFLVRRLNCLEICGKPHTRNMYRREWRSGENAEITLQSDEQKLVTALVQKKVGEMLDKKGGKPSFQTGLLASFESYAESTKSLPVEFDGDISEKESSDAQDKHVIGAISDSYIRAGLGRTLPHPKMDSVCTRLADQLLRKSRKQIAFVRRVKSVKEIKNKLDDHYTQWLAGHIQAELVDHPHALSTMNAIIHEYLQQSREREEDISGGDFHSGRAGEAEDKQPPKKDTLFTWYFRGDPPEIIEPYLEAGDDSFTTPEAMRVGLGARNQIISSLLEINWVQALSRHRKLDLMGILEDYGDDIARRASGYTIGALQKDQLEIFEASQLGFLDWYGEKYRDETALKLIDHYSPKVSTVRTIEISTKRLTESLQTQTLFGALEDAGLLNDLFPPLTHTIAELSSHENPVDLLQRVDIHSAILSLCLRTGHGVIDLYLARLKQGAMNLTAQARVAWMNEFVQLLVKQSRTEEFSTYLELKNLADNFDLIIKTNLPEIYDKSRDEYRKYLSQNLNPVAPIVGATGETVSSRSAQARKFRMPGYPLALISTDVFQEGEDLHTFCDSVMHYGLSGSPVSIEQKTGRVDRVGSAAQRRLLALDSNETITDEKLIQVSFPFVRESIEVFQVRQLCHNINAFIESLHKVGSETVDIQDIIETEQAMKDRSAIPDQIRTPLSSPYVPRVTDTSKENNRELYVTEQANHTTRILRHIEKLLHKRFGRAVLGTEGLHLDLPDGSSRPLNIKLRSARASGEILLCAETPDTEVSLHGMSRAQLYKLMRSKSWLTFHRTYAVETASRTFQLYHDAELMVGDQHTTTPSELSLFFERFTQDHDPGDYLKPSSNQTKTYWKQAAQTKLAKFGQWKAKVSSFLDDTCLGLTLSFGDKGLERQHHIKIHEVEGRCIFLACAATPETARSLTVDQLVRLTWQRNRHIDLVEFMIDGNGALVGRAIHPIEGMTFKEFIYCVYTLAASTDRLEYLIHQHDIH